MQPLEAFHYLLREKLPIILSFPLEEEKGHLITGKGICHVEAIHGSSRVTFSSFSPAQLLNSMRLCQSFYATFNIQGTAFGCIVKNLVAGASKVTGGLPDTISPYARRYLRVEPSLKSPVLVYVRPPECGTLCFTARDISECGLGFVSPVVLSLEKRIVCGIELPGEGMVLSEGSVVYRRDSLQSGISLFGMKPVIQGVSYGLELSFHPEDTKRVRKYIMQREVEIRRLILQW
jgi:hypothetical protein